MFALGFPCRFDVLISAKGDAIRYLPQNHAHKVSSSRANMQGAVVNINKAARPIFDQPLSTKASALGERDMDKFDNVRKFGDDKNIVSKNAIGVGESAENGRKRAALSMYPATGTS